MISLMKTKTSKRIFISRYLTADSPFHKLIDDGHEVIAHSLISIEKIDFAVSQAYEAVFFYSQNAIKYFFQTVPYSQHIRYGVMGKGSQKVFETFTGAAPDYIGAGDNTRIATEIDKLWPSKTVLFPQAKNSLSSIESLLQNCKTISVDIYNNKPITGITIPDCDLYLFTSPMNAEAFLVTHKLGKNTYAIGPSTAHKIKSLTSQIVLYPSEASIENLYYLTLTKLY